MKTLAALILLGLLMVSCASKFHIEQRDPVTGIITICDVTSRGEVSGGLEAVCGSATLKAGQISRSSPMEDAAAAVIMDKIEKEK